MKQILQNLKTGETEIASVPIPAVTSGQLLIATSRSLISAGTERMLIEFGKANLLEKAQQKPEKLNLVFDKIKSDGLIPTIEAVLNKLDQPLPLGYCNVGRVLKVGPGETAFVEGDRVVSNGNHAEVISVPFNLCAKIPDNVTDDQAAFTVLGAIALQGIRLVKPTLGEIVVVIGLGLLGLITIQLLRANGCRVLGVDFDSQKLKLARKFGVEVVDLSKGQDPVKVAKSFSRERGVDAVIITATTKSSEPLHQAASMCRKRGRIVLVGVSGLELSREDFFKKELTFQVSASYGPGRYDPNYEEKGNDYPIGFVRWTEQRNFEAILDTMADGNLDLQPLISHKFSLANAKLAYNLLISNSSSLGILLEYPRSEFNSIEKEILLTQPSKPFFQRRTKVDSKISISFIGAGNFATGVLLPAFKDTGVLLRTIVSKTGISGTHAGKKFGFEKSTTDSDSLFFDQSTKAIVISTRHDSHAICVQKAINAGKHVFVEKPLCLTLKELSQIKKDYYSFDTKTVPSPIFMVGFNRRFAPQVQKIKQLLAEVVGAKAFVITVNAGSVPEQHWTLDKDIGGGRIIGEACHFVDLLRFLADSKITKYNKMVSNSIKYDNVILQLAFEDGSIGTINYFANGNKSFPKEQLTVFVDGRVLMLDNFRKLKGFGWPMFKTMTLLRQDKGHKSCAKAFVEAIEKGLNPPIPVDEIFEVSRVSIELAK